MTPRQSFVTVICDLLMYEDAGVFEGGFKLLLRHFSQEQALCSAIVRTQVREPLVPGLVPLGECTQVC